MNGVQYAPYIFKSAVATMCCDARRAMEWTSLRMGMQLGRTRQVCPRLRADLKAWSAETRTSALLYTMLIFPNHGFWYRYQ